MKLNIGGHRAAEYRLYLGKNLRSANRILRSSLNMLSIVLVTDARVSELHERFMGIAGPTDVLTFALEHNKRGRVTEGEVVICFSEARRAALRAGTSVKKELLLYALHGMLHLSGFDDRTPAGFEKMHRKEDQILTELGIGPVFRPASAGRSGKKSAGEG